MAHGLPPGNTAEILRSIADTRPKVGLLLGIWLIFYPVRTTIEVLALINRKKSFSLKPLVLYEATMSGCTYHIECLDSCCGLGCSTSESPAFMHTVLASLFRLGAEKEGLFEPHSP